MVTNRKASHPFDKILADEGRQALIDQWHTRSRENPDESIQLLNDPELQFPSLYILKDEVSPDDPLLSVKNTLALLFIIDANEDPLFEQQSDSSSSAKGNVHDHYECLQWILGTGSTVVLDNEYARVIDSASIQLLIDYKDHCHSEVIQLLFLRHRNSAQRHYLQTALFDTADPTIILMLSRYLRSAIASDVKLARKLLKFIPGLQQAPTKEAAFLIESWFEDNNGYLLFTGETHDSHPDPIPFTVHYAAKYLGKPIDPKTGRPIGFISLAEQERWLSFKRLPIETQAFLSTVSSELRHTDRMDWMSWMDASISVQLEGLNQQ